MIWTPAFWKGAAERAIKTFAQVLVGYFVVGTTGLIGFDWAGALSVAGAATVASLLTSIGNSDFTSGAPAEQPIVIETITDDDILIESDGKHVAE